jgi:pimeloyl-ACP methyl ester carboxylesterase
LDSILVQGITRSYLPIGSARIYYEIWGGGAPVLLLHGGLGGVEDFSMQKSELAKHFKVIAFDRPGHGHTADTEEPFSYSIMLRYTIDFMESLNLENVNLLGWSDGAIISLLLAISRPDLVTSMVCVSGNFNTSFYTTATKEWLNSSTPDSFRKDQPAVLKRYEEASPDGAQHFSVIFRKTMKMWFNEPDIPKEKLADVPSPTLIMAADRDVMPLEHTIELFRSIKNAELCIIPGATHFLLSEKHALANAVIFDFIKKHSRGIL